MFHLEHSEILSTFIKLPFVIKIYVLSIFEWPFYTGFTVPVIDNPVIRLLTTVCGLIKARLHAFHRGDVGDTTT